MSLKYNLSNVENLTTTAYFNPTKVNDLDHIMVLLRNNNINVYPNDENTDINNNYNNVTSYIYRIIKNTRFLCKGLNSEYILDSFNTVDAVIIISSSDYILPNGNVYGFALINFNENNNSIYIDVICSHVGIKGAGDVLIKQMQNIGKNLFMTHIYLTSVSSAITFYEKYGFVKKDSLCNDMCLMVKILNKKGGKNSVKNKKYKNKRTKRNNRKGRHSRYRKI